MTTIRTSDIQPGTLFAPSDRPTLYVVPAHTVIDGQLLSMDSGFLFDAKCALGARFPLDAGLAVRSGNRSGRYGLLVLSEPHRDASGVALFQTRFSWWEAPREDLIRESFEALHRWMAAHPRLPVRLGCPGIPYIPKDTIAEWASAEFKSKAMARYLTILSRAVPTSEDAFRAACSAPGADTDINEFLTRMEGCDGR